MTVRHLRIFVAVCEEGSITKAGEKLYVAQPTVSLAVAELEKHYNTKLFDRISKRLYITEAGRQLLQYARQILSLFDEMEQGAAKWESSGPLHVGSSITIGNCLLPGLITRFKEQNPQVDVFVSVDNSDQIEQTVLEGKVDFGLIEGLAHSPHLHSEAFYEDELALVCPVSHPWSKRSSVKPQELAA